MVPTNLTVCAVLLCVAALCIAAGSTAPIEIPCTTTANSSTFFVSSNNTYTLTDCMSDLLFIDLTPTQTSSMILFENVTVRVVGGNVLPRLRASSTHWVPLSIRNVAIIMIGAQVADDVMMATAGEPALTMLDVSSGTTTVSGVSVTFVNASLQLVVGTANGAPARVAPLMLLAPGASQTTTTLQDVALVVENSFISLNVSINGASNNDSPIYANLVVMSSVSITRSGVMKNIQMSVVNSTLVLVMLSVNPPAVSLFQYMEASMFSVRSVVAVGDVFLQGASFHANMGSNLTLFCRVVRNTSDASAVVAIGEGMRAVEDVVVHMHNVTASVETDCDANCGVVNGAYQRARLVGIAGDNWFTIMRNITVVVRGSAMRIKTPRTANFITVQENAALDALLINVSDCSVQSTSSEFNVGEGPRAQTVVGVSSDNATNVRIVARQLHVVFTGGSGNCLLATSSVVSVLDNISNARIDVVDVVVIARIINGTATILGLLAMITINTNIVYLGMQNPVYVNTGNDITINVVNVTLDAIHAPTLPPGPLYMLAVSIASIVDLVRSLTNCSIAVANSHVVRSPLPSAPLLARVLPPFGTHLNVTAVVALFDAAYAALTTNGYLSQLELLIYSQLGGVPAQIVHTNVTTRITSNCTVSYITVPDASDNIALIMPPSVSRRCTYIILATSAASVALPVGAVVAAVGQSRIVNSTITARHVHCLAMLLFASLEPIIFEGSLTSLVFDNVSVHRGDYGLDMNKYAIGTEATTIDALVDSPTDQSQFLTIHRCVFRGFTALLMPTSFVITSAGHSPRSVVIALICNVWDGAGLATDSVTTNATLLQRVQNLECSGTNSIEHRGFVWTHTSSMKTQLPTPVTVSSLAVSASSTNAAVYATMTTASTGGSVASLQRSMSALRLTTLCSEANAQSTLVDDGARLMSHDLSENPLRLQLPVGEDALRYAAGAAFGNALLACAISLGLHGLAKAKQGCSGHGRLQASAAAALPSSLLMGALAVPFGTLGQPAIAACVGLVVSRHRTAQSVVCGVVMVCAWLAFPVCCVYLVLVRGRRGSRFVLESVATVAARGERGVWDVDGRACLRTVHRLMMERRETWRVRLGPSRHNAQQQERRYGAFLLERMEGVFGAYVGGREWYFAVEWSVLVVSGAVLGAAEVTTLDDAGKACTAAQWGVGVSLGLSMVQLVLCVWLRPINVRAEFAVSVLLGAMSVVCQGIALAGNLRTAADVNTVASMVAVVFTVIFLVNGVVRAAAAPAAFLSPSEAQWSFRGTRSIESHKKVPHVVSASASVGEGRLTRLAHHQLKTLIALICDERLQR
jgi:hypothetical protein